MIRVKSEESWSEPPERGKTTVKAITIRYRQLFIYTRALKEKKVGIQTGTKKIKNKIKNQLMFQLIVKS